MSEEHTIDAVAKRISELKGFLTLAIGLFTNRIGHCLCTKESPCVECEADESFIRVVERKLKGE